MTGFTPLIPIAKSTSSTSTPTPALQKTNSLPTMPPPVPKPTVPTLEKTVKGSKEVPKAITAPTSAPAASNVGFNPPTLEKVSKAPSKASTTPDPASLRPSWSSTDAKPPAKATETPKLEATSKSIIVDPKTPVRIENPNDMYIITCDVHALGCDSVNTTGTRKLIHGIFTYPEVMKMEGSNLTEKLIKMVTKQMLHSFPPFLAAGVALGTAVIEVKFPINDVTGDVVATIEVKAAEADRQYRTLHIKRFRHNMFTSFVV